MATRQPWSEAAPAELEQGREAFVTGRYWRAHRAWLEPWRAASGRRRSLLQGLIQAAGAYLKQKGGNATGMVLLLDRALERLESVPDGEDGLEIEAFRAGLRRSRDEAVAWRRGGPVPGGPARLGRSQPDQRAAP